MQKSELIKTSQMVSEQETAANNRTILIANVNNKIHLP
jgi:hypothetical protein